MAEEHLKQAVEEIKKSTHQAVVQDAANKALESGDNAALNRALIYTREVGNTAHVIEVANKALGFEKGR